MDKVSLDVDMRSVTGKAVKKLRAEGVVPAVIHDHGKASVHVSAPYMPLAKAYQQAGKHHPVALNAGGKHYTALIKAVDVDPQKHQLRHVVFNAVHANEKVTAEIPVHIKLTEDNESTPAERAGLVVLHQLEAVEVEAVANALPDALYFDGETLAAAGDSATVADLIVPSGVTIKTDPTHPLATVFEPSALQAANDAAGGDATDDTQTADDSAAAEAAEPAAAAHAADKKDA